jgi:AraC-like DNA-binding protein/quercetin dioxygenase-like cupin family protein
MSCGFILMDRHLEAPRVGGPGVGKVVLSRLAPGHSMIGASAPSLKLILDGEGRYEVDGRTVTVRAGEFLYLDAGSACIASNRVTTTGLCVGVPAADAGGADPLLGRTLVFSNRTSRLGRALQDYGIRIARDPRLGDALAGELLARVRQAIAEPLAASRAAICGLRAAKLSTRRELQRRLERARAFLHDHDDRGVSLAEMAASAGLSQFHLARHFRDTFGEAPIAYHRALRLARAADWLARGHSVAAAAEATGYSDPVALSHAFRRRYGAPPHLWMRQRGFSDRAWPG